MEEKKLPHDHGQSMERELEQMPSVDDFQTVADIFKQLGDGSRIRIFWLLCHCEDNKPHYNRFHKELWCIHIFRHD